MLRSLPSGVEVEEKEKEKEKEWVDGYYYVRNACRTPPFEEEEQEQEEPFQFNCSNLQEIYLDDCMNYTIPELKKVVAARNRGLTPTGRVKATESDGPPCILELYVTGMGPVLEVEDKIWFEKRLPLFYWDTRQTRL